VIGYDQISYFYDGLAMVDKDGRCGYIDVAGKIILPFEYTDTDNFVLPISFKIEC
jgi:hypothetical protein